MKKFLIRNEEKVFSFCIALLMLSVLSSFFFLGISKEVSKTVANVYFCCLAFSMTFSVLFPFVVMDLKDKK